LPDILLPQPEHHLGSIRLRLETQAQAWAFGFWREVAPLALAADTEMMQFRVEYALIRRYWAAEPEACQRNN
jgi:hypothetical protein